MAVGDERKKIVRNKGEAFHKDCLKRKIKFPASLMNWGCMSAQGVGRLQFIEGTVNAPKYQEILKTSLLPSIPSLQYENKYVFQQDGASCHTAKSTKAWLKNHNIPTLENWPPSSPDLSPIETLWWKMKKKLRKDPAKSKEDLKNKITAVWDSISSAECAALVDTMPQRIEATRGKTTLPSGRRTFLHRFTSRRIILLRQLKYINVFFTANNHNMCCCPYMNKNTLFL